MNRRHLLLLLALSAIWGSSFLFIKVGVRELAPATLVDGRLLIAAVLLASVALLKLGARRLARELRAAWRPLVLVGVLNGTIPFWLLTWGEKRLDSGLAAIIQAAAPIFTALLALRIDRAERLSGLRLAGLLGGFVGVGLLVGVQPSGDLLSAFAVIGNAFCYSLAVLLARRWLGKTPPLVTAFGTLGVAALVMLPAGVVQAPAQLPGWRQVGSVVALGVVCTGLAYVIYFELVAGAGATRAILVTYLVPAAAVFYGAVVLGEPVEASALGGLALVLGGVALATGTLRPRLRRRAEALAAAGDEPGG